MKIINLSKNTVVSSDCSKAATFFSRFRGLMFTRTLPVGKGLLITPCSSVHMCFMRYPLDIVFVDGNNVVVHVQEALKPWRVSRYVRAASSVLELPAGTAASSGTLKGDRLRLE